MKPNWTDTADASVHIGQKPGRRILPDRSGGGGSGGLLPLEGGPSEPFKGGKLGPSQSTSKESHRTHAPPTSPVAHTLLARSMAKGEPPPHPPPQAPLAVAPLPLPVPLEVTRGGKLHRRLEEARPQPAGSTKGGGMAGKKDRGAQPRGIAGGGLPEGGESADFKTQNSYMMRQLENTENLGGSDRKTALRSTERLPAVCALRRFRAASVALSLSRSLLKKPSYRIGIVAD